MNFPYTQGTYGLIYAELNKNEKITQIKTLLAKEYQIDPISIKLYSNGAELTDDLVVNVYKFKGEILYFTINILQVGASKAKVGINYET